MNSQVPAPAEGEGPFDSSEKTRHRSVRQIADLMDRIAAARAEIHRKETVADDLEMLLQKELAPLEAKWLAARADTFRALGRHLLDGWLPRKAQRTLLDAATALADELEGEYGVDLRAERQEYLGEAAGPEPEMQIDVRAKRGQENRGQQDEDAESGDRAAGPESHDRTAAGGPRESRPGRPGSKAFQRRAEKEQSLAGDIRALYLLLARALHPDKERDPDRRGAKTTWMQKVTDAYGRKDLGGLLDILVRNPLDAVGPYLAEAPFKTLQGFAKRLRKEASLMELQAAQADHRLPPFLAGFLRGGAVDEARIQRQVGEMKRAVKMAKQRRDAYRTRPGAEQLVEGLKAYSWQDLL